MRKACAIFAGSIATLTVLVVLATPALARTGNAAANAPKADDPSAPAACRSYVQAADGEWKPMPCQEVGAPAQAPTQAPTQHKHAAGNADTATH